MEGLDTLLPLMTEKRIVRVPRELFNSFIESNDNQITFEKLVSQWNINDFQDK